MRQLQQGNTFAPIAVFAYKRPGHLTKTLEALSRCDLAKESSLFIFCDGCRSEKDLELVNQVRVIARAQNWCRDLHVIEQPRNLGLSKSITDGVTSLCEKYGKIIVLEDDLQVSQGFLEYMNEGLRRYESDERVMEISGYMYPVETPGPHDAFFMMHASCWGWATWQRAWKHFGSDEREYDRLKIDRQYRYKFDIDGAYPYFQMLKKQLSGEIDSWGIFWYLTVFKLQGLILMPRKTLVKNIGQDETGTHVTRQNFNDELMDFRVNNFPPVVADDASFDVFQSFIKKKHAPWYRRIFGFA